jgi:hypothetical protein
MENVWLAVTNFYALRAVVEFDNWRTVEGCVVMFAMVSSFLMHWTEQGDHAMPGLFLPLPLPWLRRHWQQPVFYAADLAGVVALSSVLVIRHPSRVVPFLDLHPWWVGAACVSHLWSAALGRVIRDSRPVYVVTHTVWHVTVFHCVFMFAQFVNV